MIASVSVITPAPNAASTLGDALDSLLAQTFPHWQVIVVDDGSIDATAAIADSYASRDPRIRVLRNESTGAAASRNAGIAAATGEWLLFLDADDWLAPEALEHFVPTATSGRLFRPGWFPRRLVLAEVEGALRSPWAYRAAQAHARQLIALSQTQEAVQSRAVHVESQADEKSPRQYRLAPVVSVARPGGG